MSDLTKWESKPVRVCFNPECKINMSNYRGARKYCCASCRLIHTRDKLRQKAKEERERVLYPCGMCGEVVNEERGKICSECYIIIND